MARRRAREVWDTRGRSMPRRTIARKKPVGSSSRVVCLIFNARGTIGIAEAVEPEPFAQRSPAIDVLAVALAAGREARAAAWITVQIISWIFRSLAREK